ncbi:right-handed parallel beta-helix repeat-containing protein [Acidocella aromatica]|uniref:Parallel beta-helix repeat protein n=1 Tax=Acidocella aromatica TaxID=1303579 RepID=A0A840VCN8_9PROT|nr:right-handed parallel beta-helix repeat-containing protein [Acidocella aromatica]MBB5373648.1 parallel beta-helix repeat protein [Acidocella aromatica]
MTTIGQLPPAASVSDSDEIAIFQNGQTLAATRAQILAGTQAALTLPANTLLGNGSSGTAAPGAISIGANLAVSGNTLSATAAPFVIPSLTTGGVPGVADTVPLGQGGANVGVPYATFMSGMGNVSGLPGGALTATASGATTVRTVAALAANAVSIEDFGAKGDGVTDDGAALLAAIASGMPVRFGAKTYAIAGECDITGTACTLLGVPGLTVLTRPGQTKIGTSAIAAWISVSAATFYADGIIFDGNSSITTDTMGVAVQAGCTKSLITRCLFRNMKGSNNGSGLTYLASDPTLTQHHVDNCEFTANAQHGLYANALDALSVTNCRAHDNAVNGIYVDSMDPTFTLKIRALHIISNTCWNNNCGIIVGNFIVNNLWSSPLVYGNANPDVLGAVIASNNCYSNLRYGIYISGRNILVSGNLCTNNSSIALSGAGILCDTGYCKITGNMITGNSAFGIDCGGSIYTEVDNNYINGALIGLNIGGGQYCTARANFIQDCTAVGIAVQNVEADGSGDTFNLACTGLSIIGNWITYAGSVAPIEVRDAAQNVLIEENVIYGKPGANMTTTMSIYTDTAIIRRNTLNFTTRWAVNPAAVNGVYTLTVPDIADAVTISQSTAPIASIVTLQGAKMAGQVTFAKVTNGGSGYTSATVSFSGTGTGAAGKVWLSGGVVIGIQMTNFGSGYGAGTTATISGNGAGATVTVQVGLPVWKNKELAIDCTAAVTFATAGSSPTQSNWTGAPITVPAGATIDWIGTGSGWRAARFTQNDYVSPNGDGSLTLKTQSGDMSLHPAGSGVVRIISDTESTGAVELIGRGSPLNVVTAPAGSTFRNLNGGVGSTFWVKQSGTDSANWVAVA